MKIAVATSNGNILASGEPSTARGFVIYEVAFGTARRVEFRPNRRGHRSAVSDVRARDIGHTLSDCAMILAGAVSAHTRDYLENTGIEVVITDETIVDRAAALLALNQLPDQSRVDPEDLEIRQGEPVVFEDGFDA
ncbi:MAG TPA: NifB/NifX family molybdenum-iron cluster-binding protein [Myxococcota bacterium]|nr:NifB/NifX family molybdenum-iron cluster-binding protein [Myxococcota bacterium]HOA13542.1 NifB/NifX family molybdenum-iron cluster-binding protein [Myxococcota bacterium]HOD00135.1 NifB/NifX family molybdenum-iron cluster-binding protein [Myxococcota bacterium]HOH76722.1 NifB/NifX family molybdenum-iron cluster-binding protein [Myxococcota bacterium]HPV03842.1 NifB/NifX family molybdenum-iron cluster-binding protein [Myxococcota bacterium]